MESFGSGKLHLFEMLRCGAKSRKAKTVARRAKVLTNSLFMAS